MTFFANPRALSDKMQNVFTGMEKEGGEERVRKCSEQMDVGFTSSRQPENCGFFIPSRAFKFTTWPQPGTPNYHTILFCCAFTRQIKNPTHKHRVKPVCSVGCS